MPTLSLVTFISGDEIIAEEFLVLADFLRLNFTDLDVRAFTNRQEIVCDPLKQTVSCGTTKYARIQQLLVETRASYCLCIDNDITPNQHEVLAFLQEAFASQADLSWGRIGVVPRRGIVANMIKIDKIISHHVIRPTLWKLGLGASLPGQLFLIKSESFYGKLLAPNTVFDDLAIGICAKQYNCRTHYSTKTLGLEKPKITLTSLLAQRIRWARGFAQILIINWHTPKNRLLVLVHGISYHLLWLPIWGLIFAVIIVNVKLALLLWVLISLALTFGHMSLVLPALFYSIIFPAVHLTWLASMLYFVITMPQKYKLSSAD